MLIADVVADRKLGGLGLKKSVQKVRAKLNEKQVCEEITGPVKETLTAGKQLLSAGHGLLKWMGQLIKS